MKKKLLSLLTLMLCVGSTAWGATVDDLVAISSNYTFIADDFTSNGTVALTANTLYDNGRIFTSTGNSSASNKGNTTFAGASHLNSLRIKNTQDVLAFKVSGDCTVTFYTQSHNSRGLQVGSTNGGTEYGTQSTSTSKFEVDVKAGVVYLSSFGGDLFIAGFEVSFGATGTKTPTITQSGSTVTLACGTSEASIYYTIDGTTPTTSSTTYTTPFNIDNSCTVRTFAQKDENASEEATKDCYVDHSSVANYLTTLGYSGGTPNDYENIWTSTDGQYILTDESWTESNPRTIQYTNLAGSQDGFKINHTDYYTLKVGEDIKVTKIVVVGKSWLAGDEGNASTIAFDGFTPSSVSFYDYLTGGETYVKTAEFTPSSELDYGATITMRPGKNQLGAYIEVYGVKRSGPEDPITITEVATINTSNGSISNSTWTMTDNSDYTFNPVSLKSGTTDFKIGKGGTYTITVPSGVAVAKLDITGYSSSSDGTSLTIGSTTATFPNTSTTNTYTITSPTNGASITFTTESKEMEISEIKLYIAKAITLTTSDYMAGWRAFYDASNSYTVDENTKVYVATANSTTSVTLTELSAGIPRGTAVLLHTTSSADNHKMTLTKASVSAYEGTNLLSWTTSAVSDVYRLGYGDSGVGFYPYSGTPSSGAVILNTSSASPARALTISFSNDGVNGIESVETGKGLLDGEYYDLQGRRVAQPTKGLYILNGKKVVMK